MNILLIPRRGLVSRISKSALLKAAAKVKTIPVTLMGRSVGTVSNLKVTKRGLVGDVTYTAAGKAAVTANAFKFISPKVAKWTGGSGRVSLAKLNKAKDKIRNVKSIPLTPPRSNPPA